MAGAVCNARGGGRVLRALQRWAGRLHSPRSARCSRSAEAIGTRAAAGKATPARSARKSEKPWIGVMTARPRSLRIDLHVVPGERKIRPQRRTNERPTLWRSRDSAELSRFSPRQTVTLPLRIVTVYLLEWGKSVENLQALPELPTPQNVTVRSPRPRNYLPSARSRS